MSLSSRAKSYILLLAWGVAGAAVAQSDAMQRALEAYESGDFETAAQLWEPLAVEGNAQAQYSMAVLFHKGQGRQEDFDKALEWYREAAEQDHVNSLFNLGVAYWEGRGVRRDQKQAVQWWSRAAELGYGAAQHNLATAYYLGQGAQKDLSKAVLWFGRAVSSGYARAEKALAVLEDKHPELFADTGPAGEPSVAAADESPASDQPMPPPPTEMREPPTTMDRTVPADRSVTVQTARVGPQGAKIYPFYKDSLPVLGELPADSPVRFVLRHGEWVYVQVPGGVEAWVYGRYVEGDGGAGIINSPNVRARPLPSTGSSSYPLGAFNSGETVEVLEVDGDWKKVRAPERLGVWARAANIVLERAVDDAAESMVPATSVAVPGMTRVGPAGAKVYPFSRESLPTIIELPPDSPIRLVFRQGDWVYVQVPGGLEVWVYGRYVDSDSGAGTINAADVRARPLPSTARRSYPLGTFSQGDSVEVLEVQGEWKKVRAPEKLGAWMKLRDISSGANRES